MKQSSIFRPELFQDKVAIVTGGATGIGLAIAEELAMGGAKVAIASRKKEKLIPAAKGLSHDYQTEVEPFICNIRERVECQKLAEDVIARFGKIDFLVNNGGGQFISPAEKITEKGWKAVIDTNLNGTWHMCQAVGEKWMYNHGGRIINMLMNMWKGYPGFAHSGAARAGVQNLTMTLAIEWAKFNIRINAIAPGSILSTGLYNYPPELKLDSVYESIPLKTFGTMEQIAQTVAFMLSPAADFMTGATIKMDGGASLWGDQWPIPNPKEKPQFFLPKWPEERWPEFALKETSEGP